MPTGPLGIAGQCTLELPGETARLARGREILIPTDIEVTYRARTGARFYWLYFQVEYAVCV